MCLDGAIFLRVGVRAAHSSQLSSSVVVRQKLGCFRVGVGVRCIITVQADRPLKPQVTQTEVAVFTAVQTCLLDKDMG